MGNSALLRGIGLISVLVAVMVFATTFTKIEEVVAASTTNGDFESGTFAGWTVVDAGSGGWFVYSGTSSPIRGSPISAPPEGTFAATTDQPGPGSHILYQDIVLESGCSHTLSFLLYYENEARDFVTPPSLSHASAVDNQQYRVDLLNPAAPVDSVAGADVLANVFQTNEGDPTSLPPTPVTFDLSSFAGSTVRLRFAQVDNQFFFRASADDVQVVSECATEVDLDIKPGSASNSINCKNERGVVPVAILTTVEFDATTVDHTTVTFEGASETHVDRKNGVPRRHEEDVDNDGDTDLVFHFRFGDTNLTCASTEGSLEGLTFDGQAIVGVDAIRMVYQNGG